jgi:hypothetical protein
MPLPVHNVTASTANLARAWLQSLDPRAVETKVPTATLRLWLTTLIELAEPQQAQDAHDVGQRTVMGHIATIGDAMRARDG